MRVRLSAVLATAVALLAAPGASASSFSVACPSSHVAADDPIVMPGHPGMAHEHEFFGATSTDAASTTASLRASPTTCASAHDTAAYWAPTLVVHGVRVRGSLVAWYERGGKPRAAAPPSGLRMIAGEAHLETAQPLSHVSWQCTGAGRGRQSAAVPACRRGERLAGWLRFPDCWDGRHLDSTDHRSHVAYAASGRCPRAHPVELMRLVLRITWPVHPRPGDVRLAGGMLPASGWHGDFWNAWDQPFLRQLRWDCIEVAANCGAIS